MALAELIKDKCMSAFVGMPVYSCHKQVNATPLTRGLYNAARGWEFLRMKTQTMKATLSFTTLGPMTSMLAGRPKHIFDAGYSEQVTLTHFERMLIEASEMLKLPHWISSSKAILFLEHSTTQSN